MSEKKAEYLADIDTRNGTEPVKIEGVVENSRELQLLDAIYQATRMARLTANDHDQLAQYYQELFNLLANQQDDNSN